MDGMEDSRQSLPLVAAAHTQNSRSTRIVGMTESAESIRTHPWDESPLGPVQSWSPTLITTLNLVLSSPIAAAIYWGPEMIFLCNDATARFLGARSSDVIGQPAQSVWGPHWPGMEARLQTVLSYGTSAEGRGIPFNFSRTGRSSEVFLNYSLSPIFDDGQVVGIFTTLEDTTDSVMAMRALAESDARLRMALSAGKCVGVFDWHIQTATVFADETTAGFYGIDPGAAVAGTSNKLYEQMLHPDDIPLLTDAMMACINTGVDYSVDYRVRRPDHTYRWIQSKGRCIYDENGHACRVTGIKLDVTDRKTSASLAKPVNSLFSEDDLRSLPAHIASFITATANLLAHHPDDLSLLVVPGAAETQFVLQVAASDLGNVIGKQGRIIRAVRVLLQTVAAKCNHRFYIDVESKPNSSNRP